MSATTLMISMTVSELQQLIKDAAVEAATSALQQFKKDSENEDTFLTLKETADLLKVSQPTIYNMQKRGEIEPIKMGKSVRFRRSDVLLAYRKKNN